MEGLFVVIMIIVGIANAAMKQQKQQNRTQSQANKRLQQSRNMQEQIQRPKPVMQQPAKTVRNVDVSWGKEFSGAVKESEGIEAEDRGRTGSLNYTEESQSSEGNESEVRKNMSKSMSRKTASKSEISEAGNDAVFEFKEDDLARSIVMAEILGPPRALKRNIR